MTRMILILLCCITITQPAQAFFGLAVGAYVAGRQLRSSIDKAEQAARRLMELGNSIGRQYLTEIDILVNRRLLQIDKIAEDRLNQSDKIIKETMRDIEELEVKINSDLLGTIRSVECATDRSIITSVPTSVGTLFRWFGGNTFVLNAPPLKIGENTQKKFKFDSYNISSTVDDVTSYLNNRLDQLQLNSPIQTVQQTYMIVSYINFKAICFAPSFEKVFLDKHLKYSLLALQADNSFSRGQ